MKTKAFLLFWLLIFSTGFCGAQNLVPNPSFENYNNCPSSTNQVDSCISWSPYGGITGVEGTPDYFNVCALNHVTIPNNIFGYQNPFDGNAYMGLFTWDYSPYYREYIGTQLIDTLRPGYHYNASMRVSRAWRPEMDACVSTNNIGILFTTLPYTAGSQIPVNNYCQLKVDSIVTDTLNWIFLSWDYIPDSAYRYLYIGNFFDSPSTDTLSSGCEWGRAYYFIDDVRVACIDNGCIQSVTTSHVAEPIIIYESGTLKIQSLNGLPAALTLSSSNGQRLISRDFFNEIQYDLTQLSSGLYIVEIWTVKNRYTKKLIVH